MSNLPPRAATSKLGAHPAMQQLAGNVPAPVRPAVRDTLLAAMAELPKGMTCGDCARAYTSGASERFGFCSAFPPVAMALDGKAASRDPIVNWDRPACVLFQKMEVDAL